MGENVKLEEMIQIFRKRLWLISSFILIALVISIIVSFYILPPIYQAETQILVNEKSNSQDSYSWDRTESDLSLINTYNDIITSPAILNEVIKQLTLDIKLNQLAKQITVSSESNSKVITLKVLDESATRAMEIANTIAAVFQDEIPKLMSINNINILSPAMLNDNPSPVKPNKLLNIVFAIFVGFIAGVGLALLLEIFDTTIKTERDIEDILGLPIMGIVGSITHERNSMPSLKSRRIRRTKNVWNEEKD